MKRAIAAGFLALSVSCQSLICGGAEMMGFKTVAEQPEITDEILLNPGMGLFIMPGFTGDYEKDWWWPIVAVGYFRVDWSLLEPEEGKFKFDEVLGPAFDYWLKRGKRVALRVMSSNMHSRNEYVTPKWVFDEGVPEIEHRGLFVARQIDPPFWNATYMKKQEAFIRALGKKYNGMKGLEFVDIGSVGEWGESHLMRWSSEDKEKSGYTPFVYTKTYLRFLDVYREAFPDTPLALNCLTGGAGHNDVIVDYAVSKGIWLRQDGLVANYSREGASRYYHQYFRRVKTLYELCYGYKGMAEHGMTAMDTFKRGLEDPISYLNLMGAGEVTTLLESDREACRHAARYVGYRLAPISVEHLEALHIDEKVTPRFWLKITWRNLGVAPCYENLAIEVALTAEDGREVHRVVEMPDKPTTLWMPKEDVITHFSFPIVKGLLPGEYSINVGLVDPFDEQRHILLPLRNKDDRGRYAIGTIIVEPRVQPLPQPVIPGADFAGEKALQGWWFAKGVKGSLVIEEGKRCLRIEGKTEHGWNYAGTPNMPLLASAEYLLSVRMKVVRIDDPKKPPYVKMGLVDTEGKWFTNYQSSLYDTTRLGTWQELKGKFVTPSNTGGGHFAVEKGDTLPREAVILLDDIRLEILSAP